MANNSKIEWTEATWNPLAGCTPISPGCTHCYAATMARRLEAMGQVLYQGVAERRGGVDVFNGTIVLGVNTGADRIPLGWKKPRMVFVNSMSDLFHERVPDEFIDRVFAVMALCPQHTFQVLTKRPERMAQYVANWAHERPIVAHRVARACGQMGLSQGEAAEAYARLTQGPLPTVWLGTSVEDQPRAEERIPHLLRCPATVRFLSCEPLLGPVTLARWMGGLDISRDEHGNDLGSASGGSDLDWVIAGGESGHGARPMHPDWARSLRDQCADAGVPFFFKQWGEWGLPRTSRVGMAGSFAMIGENRPLCYVDEYPRSFDSFGASVLERVGKKAAGRLLDGVEHNGFPEQARRTGCRP